MKPAQIAQIAFIVLASFFVYAFVAMAKDGESRRACTPSCALRPNYAAQNRRVPDFTLPTLDGGQKSMSDYRGEVVILNFWTKTCGPCLEEMPSFAQLGHTLRQHPGIRLVTITTDESAEDARRTLDSLLGDDPPFDVLLDPESKVVSDLFGTKLYPETWFIDEDGIIRARVDGARDWSAALTIDFAESLRAPVQCSIEFERGTPRGPLASLCEELTPGG